MLSILLISISIVFFVLFRICYFQFLHPLSKFPGPFWASQTDFWRVYHLWTTRFPDTLLELHQKYGPVVRIGPNDLSFQDLDSITPIYKSGRKVLKSSFYNGFTTFHPNLFGTRDEELHATRRRQMAHDFSLSSLAQMESTFDRHIRNLLKTIDSFGSEPFDLKELIAYYAYDVMGSLIFNTEFGSQDSQDPELLPPINDHLLLGCSYGMLPSLLPYSMKFAAQLPWPWLQGLLKSRKALRDKTSACVDTELAREKFEERQNILSRLMLAKDPETGKGLTKDAISSEAFGFLVAGSHTTSGSLTFLFHNLLHNATASQKLSEEILKYVALPKGTETALPAYTGLEAQLPYAVACIRESFRVSPVFTMPLPRTVIDPAGMEVSGVHVPTGTNMSISNYVLHHGPAWGEDHADFRPERWMSEKEHLSPNNLLPFGTGHRACIGRNIAMMSITKVLAAVWRTYELTAVDVNEQLIMESFGISEKRGPLMVTACKRKD